MQINEVEFNSNYIQDIVDEIDEIVRKYGFSNKYQRDIRGGIYDKFYEIFFDWYSTKILSDEENNEITLKLKKIQKKLLKDMNILMVFNVAYQSVTVKFRNWFFKRIKPPKYLYHATDSLDKVKLILKIGLIPKSSEDSKRWKSMSLAFPELIFFETEPNRNRWGQYIFKIDTDELKDYKFYTDINLDARNQGFIGGSELRAIVTNKSIPPNKIELMDKKHISKLIDVNESKLNLKSKDNTKDKIDFLKQRGINNQTREFFMKDGEIDKSILPHLDNDMLKEINNYIKKFNEIIKLIPFESDGTLQSDLLRDIKDEYNINDKDLIYYINVAKENFQKEREKELKSDIEFVLDEFSETPSFTDFFDMFLKLTDPYYDYSKEEVKKMFLKLTTNPNQLSLFETEKLWKLIYYPTKEIIIKGHYSLCKWKLNELKKSVPTNKIGNYKIIPYDK
jgi:hypothetical protein